MQICIIILLIANCVSWSLGLNQTSSDLHESLEIRPEKLHLAFTGFYPFLGPPFNIPTLGSAFLIGIDSVKRQGTILENVTLEWSILNDGCSTKIALEAVVKAHIENQADVLIGKAIQKIYLLPLKTYYYHFSLCRT